MNLYKNDVIIYIPKGTEYVVTNPVKVKQNDGSWKDGISYHEKNKEDQVYIRTLDQLEKFQLK